LFHSLSNTFPNKQARLGPEKFDALSDLLLGEAEVNQIARFFCTSTAYASAVCSTMKPTQLDGVAEALVVVYSQGNQVVKLIEWLITDEVAGTGQSSKKFDVPNTEGGEVKPVRELKSGYLKKIGGNFKNWRRRWFVLTDESLSYFKEKEDDIPIQAIEMRVCSAIKYMDDPETSGGFIFALSTPGRMYKFAASTEAERVQWIEAIKPFVEKGLLANLMKASKRTTIVKPPGSPGPSASASSSSLSPNVTPQGDDSSKPPPRTRANVDRGMAARLLSTIFLEGSFPLLIPCFFHLDADQSRMAN